MLFPSGSWSSAESATAMFVLEIFVRSEALKARIQGLLDPSGLKPEFGAEVFHCIGTRA